MKKYIKPMIDKCELSESVYMGSGNCYMFSSEIVQRPELGRNTYVIQINGVHNSNHHSQSRIVKIVFNQSVEYINSNADKVNGNGTSILELQFTDGINGSYHNNCSDNIGLGQLEVKSSDALAILNTTCIYCNESCEQH